MNAYLVTIAVLMAGPDGQGTVGNVQTFTQVVIATDPATAVSKLAVANGATVAMVVESSISDVAANVLT